MWETRKDEQGNTELKGKILAVLPNKSDITAQSAFFSKKPKRQTVQAIEQLAIRHVP